MASTRTLGIIGDTNGNLTINKEYRRTRLFYRLGKLRQEETEQRLRLEIDCVECELQR